MKANGHITPSDKLLLLIEEHCNSETGAYWMIPLDYNTMSQRCERLEEQVWVKGPGPASSLRALVRRDLIERIPQTGGYRITDDGRLHAQSIETDR